MEKLGRKSMRLVSASSSHSATVVGRGGSARVVGAVCLGAETARAAARAAGDLDDDSDRSTTSFVASTDGGSGSTADSVSEL